MDQAERRLGFFFSFEENAAPSLPAIPEQRLDGTEAIGESTPSFYCPPPELSRAVAHTGRVPSLEYKPLRKYSAAITSNHMPPRPPSFLGSSWSRWKSSSSSSVIIMLSVQHISMRQPAACSTSASYSW